MRIWEGMPFGVQINVIDVKHFCPAAGSAPVYSMGAGIVRRLVNSKLHSAIGADEMDPFISIITVSLNAGATIEDTIASVSCQRASFGIEHICVDGGSKDATRSIIDRWVNRGRIPMRSIYESDNGIFDAMNK